MDFTVDSRTSAILDRAKLNDPQLPEDRFGRELPRASRGHVMTPPQEIPYPPMDVIIDRPIRQRPSAIGEIRRPAVIHAFLRSSDGTFITWDAPGATQTFAQAMNAAGTIAGSYLDAASVYHGYRRSRDGSFTVFDGPPGNTFVLPLSINSAGTITGLS